MKYCSFIGKETMTQKAEEQIRETLVRSIRSAIKKGACDFIYSRGAGFELFAFETLLGMKELCTQVNIILTSPRAVWEGKVNSKYKERIQLIESHASSEIDTVKESQDTYARYLGAITASDYCIVNYTSSYHCRLLLQQALTSGNEIIFIKPNKDMYILGGGS